jgi:DNA polymerase-4
VSEQEAPDDSGSPILHVDMDAFYASVELLKRPELRGTPVIVGGGTRGVVLSGTYEARAFGVHSGMPMSRARRLCPGATVIAPEFSGYRDASAIVMAIFHSITPLVEPISLDEAFLDVSGARRRLGTPTEIARRIKARVSAEARIPCTVGVAPTKFVAKLASTRGKPDGLLVIPADGVVAFLHPLPVAALWGVGARTEEQLQRLGLRTVGDLAATPVGALQAAVGKVAGAHLAELAWGRDPRPVTPPETERSIGAEETFDVDVTDHEVLARELLRLAERTAGRLRAAGLAARTVSIKIRYGDFTTVTRARTLPVATDVAQVMHRTAVGLLDALKVNGRPVRLVGVRAEGLRSAGSDPEQLELDPVRSGRREVELASDEAARRFGAGAVLPASLVKDPARNS